MIEDDQCCPGKNTQLDHVMVTRVILEDLGERKRLDHIRQVPARGDAAIMYKALSRINGNTRFRNEEVFEYINGERIETKAGRGRQALRSVASTLIPGDLDPLKSPVRSAIYRTLTPGKPGGMRGGSVPGQNRGYRCPEGYQYGGRFTDSRLSTCGVKLFDIPSLLGLALSAIRKISSNPSRTSGTPITGLDGPGDIISSRTPQIPKVGSLSIVSRKSSVDNLVKEIGKFNRKSNSKVRRMVRRDGFVLEPVVPTKVLRAIPDNRDMEGASMLMTALSPKDIGGEELGLLSNTGVNSLIYVLPGGSTYRLEKARLLTVGERRKLGRVVNASMTIDNSRDPGARLKNVESEIGPGIKYSEVFINIKNPTEVWGNRRNLKNTIQNVDERSPLPATKRGQLITSLDAAISHVSGGGSLSKIDPAILAQLLASQDIVRRQKLANNIEFVAIGDKRYFLFNSPNKYQHLAEKFASSVQQNLGLESPEVFFVGGPGDKRKYLREDVEMAIPGGKFSPDVNFVDLDPSDVARMFVADFLTDQRERPSSSIYPVKIGDEVRAVLAENTTSGLIDLSKIQITKRMKMRIDQFYSDGLSPEYSKYYQALKAEQRLAFMRNIAMLIKRARGFNSNKFAKDNDNYGLSTGEKIHLNIVGKLFDVRLSSLSRHKELITEMLKAGAK